MLAHFFRTKNFKLIQSNGELSSEGDKAEAGFLQASLIPLTAERYKQASQDIVQSVFSLSWAPCRPKMEQRHCLNNHRERSVSMSGFESGSECLR